MEYLIKDLSKLTGLSPARIRKWQERFQILEPHCATNGYWYYSNKDLFILKNINMLLLQGQSLTKIMEQKRTGLIELPANNFSFSPDKRNFIQAISENNFCNLQTQLRKDKTETFEAWVKRLSYSLILVGEAWEKGVISIADEHSFSSWFIGFFRDFINKYETYRKSSCLVVSFPGDEHTLGALLHYGLLIIHGKATRFCGMLPEQELFRELSSGGYSEVSISVTIPREMKVIQNLITKITKRFKSIKISVGGSGMQINKKAKINNNNKLKLSQEI